jgi:hypothetical protein
LRFSLRRTWWLQPLLVLLGGATGARSYLEIDDERLVVRFGWFFDNTIELSNIESVGRSRWPWYGGLGLRSNLGGLIAAVGSYGGIVEIRLKQRIRAQSILPCIRLPCRRLFVSLDEPDAFVAALSQALTDAKDHGGAVR